MFKRLRRSVEKRFLRMTCRKFGCYPIDYSEPADIFVTGYPKSGHTWMQHILCAMVFGVDPALCPDSLVQEMVIDIYGRRFYRRLLSPCYFKSHDLPSPRYRRVIYLLRDGRDAMVSYCHFLQLQNEGAADLAAMVRDGTGLFRGKWQDHVREWQRNPFGADMLVVKYESLLNKPLESLRRVCVFTGVQRTDEQLQRVVELTAFPRMRQREIEHGWSLHPDWQGRGKLFTRRGQSGTFRDEMPADVRREFERQARDVLLANGYET